VPKFIWSQAIGAIFFHKKFLNMGQIIPKSTFKLIKKSHFFCCIKS